jgi:predicted dehydrogenase
MRNMLRAATGWPDEFLDPLERGEDWHARAQESGGGMFSNSGSHFVDLILWLAGAPPVEVVAFSEAAGMPAECFLNIQARLANGVLVSITSADVPSGGLSGQGELTFIGEEGMVSYNLARPAEIWWSRDGNRELIEAKSADTTAATAFVAAILDGMPNDSPAQDGAYAVAFTEAVYRSAAEKQIIQLDLPVRA